MFLIFILSSIPIDAILDWVKYRFSGVMALRLEVQNMLHIRIIYEEIQNYLHVPFFVLLAFLWMKFFGKKNIDFKKSSVYTMGITFIFAGADELSQLFFSGRTASLFDLFLDIIGSLLGVGIYRFVSLRTTKDVKA
jgi:VanZ family protein